MPSSDSIRHDTAAAITAKQARPGTIAKVRRGLTGGVCALALAASLCAPARANEPAVTSDARPGPEDVRTTLISIARAFDESALRINDSQPADLARWSRPIYLAIDAAGDLRRFGPQIDSAVSQLAAIAGVAISRVAYDDPRRNFVVRQADPAGRAACRTAVYSQAGHIVRVEIEIFLAGAPALTRCINHEALHGFGFRSHPQAASSVLSYRAADLIRFSATDRILLETLYDPRLRPGMPVTAATRAACAVIGEKLSLPLAETDPVCAGRVPVDGRVAAFGRRDPGALDTR